MPKFFSNLHQRFAHHNTKPKIAWMSSTPMHFDMHLNENVNKYNAAANQKFFSSNSSRVVDGYIDNNAAIVDICGKPPYWGPHLAPHVTKNCSLINPDAEYHYNQAGYAILAQHVAEGYPKKLLQQQSPPYKISKS